jgi:hypothetical protein
LLAGVLVRSTETLADYGLGGALSIVPLSGVLVWIALACLALSLLGADRVGDRLMTRVIGPRPPGR